MQITQFDQFIQANGTNSAVAFVIQEPLISVAGADSPVFPPTFAPEEGSDAKPNYVIDEGEAAGRKRNIALLDSVGSQANRLEPIFKRSPYDALVPQVDIAIGDRTVNLLDAGHRAADAIVRYSGAAEVVQQAFGLYDRSRDASGLAKVNPTALVFGVWDSRGTQAKFPRLVSSTVRATDVMKLTRSAQYISMLEKSEAQEIDSDQKYLSKDGLSDAPSGRGPGGVLVQGQILREAVLNLVPLRSLRAADDASTLVLQRYIFALSLIAFTAPAEYYLRQGCLLTADPDHPARLESVTRQGTRNPLRFDASEVLDYARLAAAEFGVGQNLAVKFSADLAREAKKSSDGAKAAKKATKK
jgi:CRISPR-associated protein Csb1